MAKDIQALKKAYLQRDKVVRGIDEEGQFPLAVVRASETVRQAQQRHGLSPLAAVMLGRALAGAALLSSFLKGEERITIEAMGNGPLGKVYAEALQVGEIRGYVEQPKAMLDFSNPDAQLQDALGIGVMRVSKYLYNRHEPVSGIVDQEAGDISTDLARYLIQSEQIPSALVLDVAIDDEGRVSSAGGLLVQAMPGANDEAIDAIQDNIREVRKVSELLTTGYQPEELLKLIAGGSAKVLDSTPIDFYCRCSLERFKQRLLAFETEMIADMQQKEQRELVCQYCNEKYYLADKDFAELLAARGGAEGMA